MVSFSNPAVEEKYASYAPPVRRRLLELRELVFEAADGLEGCGEVVEELKWGQPSFLTHAPKSGSTVRLDAAGENGDAAFYFHCQSGLVDSFRELYGDTLTFKGNRALLLPRDETVAVDSVKHCLALALTHHSRKRRTGR